MERPKTKQLPIGFTDRHREMIEEIMHAKGYPSLAAVVQQAVIEFHGKVFKDYVMAKMSKADTPAPGKTSREMKKSNQTDKLHSIAEVLGGTVKKKGGVLVVNYFTYNRKNRYEQEVPLETMEDILIDKQYFPSKEAVVKLQKEGKTNYKV